MAGAGDGQLEEVQADTPAAARGDRQGVQQTGRRQVVCLDALTRRAGAHVLFNLRRQAGPPYRAARQGERLVATEVLAQRCSMELVQHLRAKRARGRDAKAISGRRAAAAYGRSTGRAAAVRTVTLRGSA